MPCSTSSWVQTGPGANESLLVITGLVTVAVNSGQTPQLPEHHTGCFNSTQWRPHTRFIQLNMSMIKTIQNVELSMNADQTPGSSSHSPQPRLNRNRLSESQREETTVDYWGVPTKSRGRCALCASLLLTLGHSRQAYLKPWSKGKNILLHFLWACVWVWLGRDSKSSILARANAESGIEGR